MLEISNYKEKSVKVNSVMYLCGRVTLSNFPLSNSSSESADIVVNAVVNTVVDTLLGQRVSEACRARCVVMCLLKPSTSCQDAIHMYVDDI